MLHGYIRQGGHSQEHSVWWWIGKLQSSIGSANIGKATGGLMKVKRAPRQVENWVGILCVTGNNNIRKDLGFKSFVHEYLLTSQHHMKHWYIISKRNTISSLTTCNLAGFITYLYESVFQKSTCRNVFYVLNQPILSNHTMPRLSYTGAAIWCSDEWFLVKTSKHTPLLAQWLQKMYKDLFEQR